MNKDANMLYMALRACEGYADLHILQEGARRKVEKVKLVQPSDGRATIIIDIQGEQQG